VYNVKRKEVINKMDDISVTIGKRLRLLREERGLSVRDVEAKTNVPKSTVGLYENGEVDQKIKVLKTLADFYNEDIEWVIVLTDKRRY
jgi:transcriptional regulator with XRE-family HTH domain